MLKQYDPTAWGEIGSDTGVVTRVRMAGREFDQESGLYYIRERYFDPQLGRFLSEDPTGINGGQNLYAYADNDPVNALDPSGLKTRRPPPLEGRSGSDGAGSIIDFDNDGVDDFQQFADYAWGWARFHAQGGTIDQYHSITFATEHGFVDEQTAQEAKQLFYFGKIRTASLEPGTYAITRLSDNNIYFNTQMADMWSDPNPRNLAFILSHEIRHLNLRLRGEQYGQGAEGRGANCFAQRAVGSHHPNVYYPCH